MAEATAAYDVVIIGGGPGGYNAAIRAGQLGLKVACVEMRSTLGGTCLNVGCMPSKALLHASELWDAANGEFAKIGIEVSPKLNLPQMHKAKDDSVLALTKGIEFLFKKNKVEWIKGKGKIVGQGRVEGTAADGAVQTLDAKNIVIATGSEPTPLPGVAFEANKVIDSTGALSLPAVPKKLIVVGAGIIGLELGSVWRRLGAEVTVLEGLPTFLGAVDEQIAKEAKKAFDKQGLKIELGVKVGEIKNSKKGVSIAYTNSKGEAQTLDADKLIISIGRVPNTIGLNAEAVGLQLDERGAIAVDGDCKTNLPGVWAVGDVVRGPMLAHKAEEEGVAVAERMAGQHGHVNFNTIPWVIYTSPEIAWVGRTEQQLKADGVKYKAGTFPFLANGRARALGDTTGMVKFLADAVTDEILGVHMVGPQVSELIAEAVVAMEFKASAEDIARICHAHPSLSEATKEAALAVDKRTLNF